MTSATPLVSDARARKSAPGPGAGVTSGRADLQPRVADPPGPEGHRLEPGAVVAGRLEPHPLELARHVGGGDVEATLARRTTLEEIVGEEADVRGDGIRPDAPRTQRRPPER